MKNIKRFTVKQIKEKIMKLKAERSNWEDHWQDVADHILTRKNTILTKKHPGQKRAFNLLDNTGMHANELLAGALHGMLTNPDLIWFDLTTGNLQLDTKDTVRKWMQKTTRQMHNTLNNSNFQTEVHELYTDLCAFGTACCLMEEDDADVVRFSTKFIADYYIEEDSFGRVNQLYREWKWNAAQIVEAFGEKKMPRRILEHYKKGSEEKFCCTHAVYPKNLVDPSASGTMKYVSQYVIYDEDAEVDVGDFASLPYLVPRFTKAAGEKYGRSPGMNALPELKILNKMNETMLIGAQKVVDPPMALPDDGIVLPFITRPGGINYYRAGSQDKIFPIFNDTRIDFGYQAMEDRRRRVRDSYYVDQLKLQQGGPMMTATEVLQRTEESMRLLGPMLGRQQSEFLRPMVDRLFNIMLTRGMIEMPPPELQGKKLDVKYSSLIAKAQKVNEGQSVLRVFSAVAPFIQMDPSVADNFNGDAASRLIVGLYGAPQEILRDVDEVMQLREQRAQQAQQQQQAQAIQQENVATDSALNMAKAAGEIQGLDG